jgi:tRNA pseudouridine(38-40) synthase
MTHRRRLPRGCGHNAIREALLAGEITPAGHLDDCPDCAALAADLRTIDDLAPSLKASVAVPPDFVAKTMARIVKDRQVRHPHVDPAREADHQQHTSASPLLQASYLKATHILPTAAGIDLIFTAMPAAISVILDNLGDDFHHLPYSVQERMIVEATLACQQQPAFVITAPPGAGKTSLLFRTIAALATGTGPRPAGLERRLSLEAAQVVGRPPIVASMHELSASAAASLRALATRLETPAPDGSHARYDARTRTYRYVVAPPAERATVIRDHVWRVPRSVDLEAMRGAAAHLVGSHDFAAFGRSPRAGGTTVRTIHSLTVRAHSMPDAHGEPGAELRTVVTIDVTADAFLYGMMRAIAATLVAVGDGRLDAPSVASLLDAPGNARPLCLTEHMEDPAAPSLAQVAGEVAAVRLDDLLACLPEQVADTRHIAVADPERVQQTLVEGLLVLSH